jgi:hypothetical protein
MFMTSYGVLKIRLIAIIGKNIENSKTWLNDLKLTA